MDSDYVREKKKPSTINSPQLLEDGAANLRRDGLIKEQVMEAAPGSSPATRSVARHAAARDGKKIRPHGQRNAPSSSAARRR